LVLRSGGGGKGRDNENMLIQWGTQEGSSKKRSSWVGNRSRRFLPTGGERVYLPSILSVGY